jgi:hypothetical protein
MSVLKRDGALAFALMSALLCGGCSTGGAVKRSEQDVARLMKVNDNLIVPGERVGSVFFGMTEAQLYQKMGDPENSHRARCGGVSVTAYKWGDLGVCVQSSTHTVIDIEVHGPSYRTDEGVSTGISELALKAKLGQPAWKIQAYTDHPNSSKLCYNSGLTVFTDDGQVTWLDLWLGHCD